jgi:hypothetical protein
VHQPAYGAAAYTPQPQRRVAEPPGFINTRILRDRIRGIGLFVCLIEDVI